MKEAVAGGDVEIVLVLGRLLGLGLDQDRSLETDLVLVLDHQRDKAAELIELAFHVGIEQRLIALAPAPEHVILAAEPMRHLERRPDLACGIDEHLWVRIGRRTRHIATVREEVSRSPQKAYLGCGHLLFEQVGDGVEVGNELGKRPAFRCRVHVVEGKERDIEQAEQLESDVGFGASERHRIRAVMPGPQESLAAERIAPRPAERVPIAHGKAQMIFKPPPTDHAIPIVPAKGERACCLRPGIGDRRRRTKVIG